MLTIYCARPISGCSGDQVFSYYKELVELFEGAAVLTPLMGKSYLRFNQCYAPGGFSQPASTDHAISQRDSWMVAQADIVYVNLLDATQVSIGCMMELAWAQHMRRHTVVVMEKGNKHEHAFVVDAADIVFRTEGEARTYLLECIAGFVPVSLP